jgi:C4-dicarboxylate-specific signal transduction histidine kinase
VAISNREISSNLKLRLDDYLASVQRSAAGAQTAALEDLERILSGIRGVTEAREQVWSGEYRFRRPDGSYADVYDRAFVIYDERKRPIRMIGAMADVSERKQALDLLEQRVTARTAELHTKNEELEHQISERQRVVELLQSRNAELKAFAYTVS